MGLRKTEATGLVVGSISVCRLWMRGIIISHSTGHPKISMFGISLVARTRGVGEWYRYLADNEL